ncbi:hypothetical protein TESG_00104 [Trichophyton tonsurans CBS 112818]|uniref:Uncharacterized protein n=1 Tax=Trichophyton tonsurans (strain CBS 112818) TaxID=647933 RepID=F2RMI1_TRIT1|nr:hypothetical protein TESG_00104 [Trichophyton tonsurans CBS 112818]
MLAKLLATSLLALQGAAAFLIVPEIDSPHATKQQAPDAHKLTVSANCAKCPFPGRVDASEVSTVDSYMLFDLSTDAGRLYINKKEVYPNPDTSVDLQTSLIRKSDEQSSRNIPTGYVFEVLRTPDSPSDPDGPELLSFYFTPVQLNGLPAAADTLYIPVIKTTNGNLVIVNSRIEATPATHISFQRCGRDAECWKRLLLARLTATIRAAKIRAIKFAAKLKSAFKGCHGKNKASAIHGHGSHRHQHPTFSRAFAHALASSSSQPSSDCVSAWLSALSALFRRQRTSPRHNIDSTQEDGEAYEKEGLMAHEDDLEDDQLHSQIRLPADKA